MSVLRTIFTAPLSLLYSVGVSVRNWVYDSKLIEPYVPDIPVVSVGNLTVGGTGKTPFTEYLIQILSQYYEVAVLSRGYKRKTKGFVLADENSTFKTVGDEPMQIKMKFPSIAVAVCEDRREGIERLKEMFPSLGVIVMDDAFQYRKVVPWLDIVMVDCNRPIYEDHMLPWGFLRDNTNQLPRAEIIIVSKCPKNFSAFDRNYVTDCLNLYAYQRAFFTQINYMEPVPLFPDECLTKQADGSLAPCSKNTKVIVMAAIASPLPFIEHVKDNFSLAGTMLLPDHHSFKMRDMMQLQYMLHNVSSKTLVFITEKDAVKLCRSSKIPNNIRKRLYYIGIKNSFMFDSENMFEQRLLKYVSKNCKHSFSDSQ